MKRIIHQGLLATSSLAVLLALGACGERVDTTTTAPADTTKSTEVARDTTPPAAPPVASNDSSSGTSVLGAGSSTGMIDDAQIVTKVNTGIAADKDLSTFKIDVDSKGGMVTLKGTVPTADAKTRAEDIAKNVKDVKSVENQLTVSG
jgi:hyperosmotically inducible protein